MQELDKFYALLKGGTDVETFLGEYKNIFPILHLDGCTEKVRYGRKPCKKLTDEISPVAHFVRQKACYDEHIRFSLDECNPVDCFLGYDRIQITVALERSRLASIRHLTENGVSYGAYLEVDEKPLQHCIYEANQLLALSNSKSDNIEEIIEINVQGVLRAIEKKRPDTQSNILIIKLPPILAMYGESAINQCAQLLREKPIYTNFSKIYSVSYAGEDYDYCFPVECDRDVRP